VIRYHNYQYHGYQYHWYQYFLIQYRYLIPYNSGMILSSRDVFWCTWNMWNICAVREVVFQVWWSVAARGSNIKSKNVDMILFLNKNFFGIVQWFIEFFCLFGGRGQYRMVSYRIGIPCKYSVSYRIASAWYSPPLLLERKYTSTARSQTQPTPADRFLGPGTRLECLPVQLVQVVFGRPQGVGSAIICVINNMGGNRLYQHFQDVTTVYTLHREYNNKMIK